jgi:hypothetical protein
MFKRHLSILLAVALLLVTSPVLAQPERVDELPEIAPFSSARFDVALAVTAEPGQAVIGFAKGEFSGDRVHAVAVDNLEGNVLEIVVIGTTLYLRENTNTRWQRSEMGGTTPPITGPASPTAPVADAPIFRVGDATVNNVATTQYQIRIDPDDLQAGLPETEMEMTFESGAIDLFIGKTDTFLHKFQVTLRGEDEELGDFMIEVVATLSAFNQPIAIGAPPANLVDAASAKARARLAGIPGGQFLPAWTRPFVAQSLEQLRAR